MPALLLVMIGGAIGTGARYLAQRGAVLWLGAAFPWGTLFVNLGGGLLMGVLAGSLARVAAGESWRLFLGVGILGGFTTFSSFSLDVVTLVQRGGGAVALGYLLASVAGSVAALVAGLGLARLA